MCGLFIEVFYSERTIDDFGNELSIIRPDF